MYHDVDTFEARDDIGGLWHAEMVSELTHPDLQNDEYFKLNGHLHCSIYENMSTNLPKYLMALKDFPHAKEASIMLKPKEYHQYLKAYYKHFKLHENVSLNTIVTSVRLLKNCKLESLPPLSPEQLSRKFLVQLNIRATNSFRVSCNN